MAHGKFSGVPTGFSTHSQTTRSGPSKNGEMGTGNPRNRLTDWATLVVCAIGVNVMAGWILQVGAMTQINDRWVSMKFVTAVLLVLCGLTMQMRAGSRQAFMKGIVFVTALYTLLSYGGQISFMPPFVDTSIGTAHPNHPSIFILVGFMLYGLVGWSPATRRRTGWILIGLSFVVAVGYIVNAPILYGYIEGLSSAMPIHAAFAFGHLGWYLVAGNKESDDHKKA